ncbi:MAG: ZIP family metal transporter [Bacteroidota bacterium]|jgi:zinc and cadmium transporter
MIFWYCLILIFFPLLGGLLGYYTRIKNENSIKLLLSFAGAYLLSIVLFHLIPHIYTEASVLSGVLILAGFFFQVFLEKFSRGVEHGHLHVHDHGKSNRFIPYEILISLSLHSFMEGMPLGSGLLEKGGGEWSFLFGVVSHEMPAAFAMVSILKTAKVKNSQLLWFIFLYSSMSALGAAFSNLIKYRIDEHVFEYIMAFVVGTFLHIATTILFENTEEHKVTRNKIIAIGIGVLLAALVSLT